MANTDYFKFVLVFLLINGELKTSDGAIGTVITVATTIMDVAELGTRVHDFIEGNDKGEDISNQDLLTGIQNSIEAAKTDVIVSMTALSRLERIENAVIRVRSSMIDLGKIISATDPDVYAHYKDEFILNYENNNVALHVRFLAELLTYQGPGQQFQLLQHIVTTNRCSMTGLLDFAEYYLNLVSEGIALHMVYDYLTKGFDPERVIEDEWKYGLQSIQSDLVDAFQGCLDQFWSLATADLQSSPSAQAMVENSAKRYIFHWTDAFFYAPVGTYQFHYRKHIEKKLAFHHADDQNKIAVFGKVETTQDTAMISEIETSLDDAKFSVPASDNERAAAEVGEAVERQVVALGYTVEAIVVYFDGEDFEEKGAYKHADSPVFAYYAMKGISLDYCFDSGITCLFGGDSTTGVFKVYLYASREASEQGDYTVGGAGTNKPGTITYTMTALLVTVRYVFT